MPATQHPKVATTSTSQPHSRTRLIIRQELPQQSLDPIVARAPGLLVHSNRRLQKLGKRVRWHPSVIDNEHKIKSRPKAPEASARLHTPLASPKISVKSTEATSSSAPSRPSTQTVLPRNSMWPAQVTQPGYPPSSTSAALRMTYRPVTWVPANTSSKRDPVPSTHRPTRRPTKRPTQRPQTTTWIPPRVPDPLTRQQPPPTPRPTRLKTPELPDIGGSKFCFCHGDTKDPACATERLVHQKMDAQSKKTWTVLYYSLY
jgi:hypothetical protein